MAARLGNPPVPTRTISEWKTTFHSVTNGREWRAVHVTDDGNGALAGRIVAVVGRDRGKIIYDPALTRPL